jgi:hypothetical protein
MYTIFSAVLHSVRQQRKSDVMMYFGHSTGSAVYYKASSPLRSRLVYLLDRVFYIMQWGTCTFYLLRGAGIDHTEHILRLFSVRSRLKITHRDIFWKDFVHQCKVLEYFIGFSDAYSTGCSMTYRQCFLLPKSCRKLYTYLPSIRRQQR